MGVGNAGSILRDMKYIPCIKIKIVPNSLRCLALLLGMTKYLGYLLGHMYNKK